MPTTSKKQAELAVYALMFGNVGLLRCNRVAGRTEIEYNIVGKDDTIDYRVQSHTSWAEAFAQMAQVKLENACRYLKKTSGRTATEGPRRILMEASKLVDTDAPGVDLTKNNIAARLTNV